MQRLTLLCSHPNLSVDLNQIPLVTKSLIEKYGFVFAHAVSNDQGSPLPTNCTWSDILADIREGTDIVENMDGKDLDAWRQTFMHIGNLMNAYVNDGATQKLWIAFFNPDCGSVNALCWNPESKRLRVKHMNFKD